MTAGAQLPPCFRPRSPLERQQGQWRQLRPAATPHRNGPADPAPQSAQAAWPPCSRLLGAPGSVGGRAQHRESPLSLRSCSLPPPARVLLFPLRYPSHTPPRRRRSPRLRSACALLALRICGGGAAPGRLGRVCGELAGGLRRRQSGLWSAPPVRAGGYRSKPVPVSAD